LQHRTYPLNWISYYSAYRIYMILLLFIYSTFLTLFILSNIAFTFQH